MDLASHNVANIIVGISRPNPSNMFVIHTEYLDKAIVQYLKYSIKLCLFSGKRYKTYRCFHIYLGCNALYFKSYWLSKSALSKIHIYDLLSTCPLHHNVCKVHVHYKYVDQLIRDIVESSIIIDKMYKYYFIISKEVEWC